MANRIARFFGFAEHGTNLRREIIGGVTTFMTMSYIVVVNPAILKAAGTLGPECHLTAVLHLLSL